MNFERNSVFGPLQDGTVALVDGRYKYVRHLGRVLYRDMPKVEDGLYDVVSDPGDNSNLITAKPDIAASMRAAIDTAVAEHSLPPRRN